MIFFIFSLCQHFSFIPKWLNCLTAACTRYQFKLSLFKDNITSWQKMAFKWIEIGVWGWWRQLRIVNKLQASSALLTFLLTHRNRKDVEQNLIFFYFPNERQKSSSCSKYLKKKRIAMQQQQQLRCPLKCK